MAMPRILQACTSLCALLAACVTASPGHAEYRFFDDFRTAAGRLVADIQADRLDPSNIGPSARSSLAESRHGTSTTTALQSLGPLRSVCPVVTVDFPNGKQFAFRSMHERGGTDWVVVVSRSPETIESIVNLGPGSGAPAILPIVPQGVTPRPPAQIGCIPLTETPATDDQLQEACRRWPKMC